MKGNVMSESELAFARIVWENAPLPSGELVTRCNEELGWKKPTTYTVLRNLCQAGIFENKQAMDLYLFPKKIIWQEKVSKS